VEVALEELQVIPLKFADAQEIASIFNQIFSGRARPTGVVAALQPRPAAPPAARPPTDGAGAGRPPLIVAYRGINVLIVHARKTELEIIPRLLNQLAVDIYGGRRIFIYYCENTKAKDLEATMNAIYGRGTVPPLPRAPPDDAARGPGRSLPGRHFPSRRHRRSPGSRRA